DLLHPRDERSGKTLRRHRHHPRRQTSCRRLAGATSRENLGKRPGGDLRQRRRPALRRRGGLRTMNLHAVSVVYRKELTEWLRDRRTLISTVLVPLLVFPMILLGFSYLAVNLIGKAEKEIPRIMVIGGEDSPQVVAALHKLDTVNIVPYGADWKNQISEKTIRAAVEIPAGFQA